MSNKSAIFIFTKDRPHTLKETLNAITGIDHPILIIDDSISEANQINNQVILSNDQCYLGGHAFDQFIQAHNIDCRNFSFLLRKLGCKEWNLGYARNFALLYSRSLTFDQVLFMDDDIKVLSLDIVDLLFDKLKTYKFTGAHIVSSPYFRPTEY